MANRTVSVILQAEIGQYVSGMTRAAVATKGVGESADMTAKKASKGFDLAGRGAQLFGLAAAGALVGIITKSMDFEKAMSGVQAATQATAATMGQLREAAIKAGADTQYSATEAANAITEMAKAGVSAKDIMGGGLAGALNLAAAGQLDVADAAGIASTAMTQFNLSGAQLPHVADLLAAGAGKAMGSVDDMGQALNQAGLLASATGISIEETTGALSAFASAGLIGSDAGTSFKTMLQSLQNPSKESAELMSELGINAYDAQGNFVGLSDLAQQLKTHLGDLTQAQRDQALAQIFGSDAARAATVLYREGAAGIDEWTAKVNDAGYAQRQAAQLTDNLSGDLERLGGSFDTLLISIGQGAQGPLRDLVQMLGGVVDGVGGAVKIFGELPGPVQLSLVAMAGWAVAGGRVLGVVDGVRDKFRGFREEQELQRALFAAQQRDLSSAAGGYSELGQSLERAGGSMDTVGYKAASAKAAIGGLARAIGPELAAAGAAYVLSSTISSLETMAHAGDAATSEIDQLEKSLSQIDDNKGRIEAISAAVLDLQGKLADAKEAMGASGSDIGFSAFNPLELGSATAAYKDASAAADEYAAAIARQEAASQTASQATDQLSQRLGISRDEVITLADKYGVDLTGSLDNVYGRFLLARASAEGMSGAQDNAASSAGAFATQMEGVAKAADDAKNATDQFKLSLDILTGAHVSLAQAESAMYAAFDAAAGALDNLTGKVLTDQGALDTHSEAGRRAQDVLFGIRDAGNEYISTLIQQGATADEAAAADANLRESFIQSAMQMGISRQAAEDLANQILGIPDERTTQINADTQAARNAISQVQTDVDNLHGKTISVTVTATGGLQAVLGNTSVRPTVGTAVGFSEGGYTGAGGRYTPAGFVHKGEVVWSQDDVAAHGGPQRVDAMRKRRDMPGYADGGIVIDIDQRPLVATMSTIMKNLEPVTGYVGALNWARSQSGKPYIWGGVGPGGYDCSGFMSAITNVIRGRSPYSRVGSTANFPWAGFASGNGLFTIGSTPNAGGGIGHMAGTLIGEHVESTGDHVRTGAAARGADNGLFSRRAHLAMANGGVIGEPVVGVGTRSGNSYSFAERGPEVVLPTGREMSGGGGWGGGSQPVVIRIDGATIDGRFEIGGDGLGRIIDGRVVSAVTTIIDRGANNP